MYINMYAVATTTKCSVEPLFIILVSLVVIKLELNEFTNIKVHWKSIGFI